MKPPGLAYILRKGEKDAHAGNRTLVLARGHVDELVVSATVRQQFDSRHRPTSGNKHTKQNK